MFEMVRGFGYTDTSLTSKNTLLPIVFWVHHRGLAESITSSVALRPEREAICAWLHTMLLKGVIGAGSADTVLAAIRRAFTGADFAAPYVRADLQQFPVADITHILRGQGKDPQITDEFINSLLLTQKDAKQAFTILALLAPNLDYRNNFHADHLHPAAAFGRRRLAASGVPDSDWAFYADDNNWNSILNLAHLDAHENMSKQDTLLADWVIGEADRQQISQAKFCSDRSLPDPTLLAFSDFRTFIAHRPELLAERLRSTAAIPDLGSPGCWQDMARKEGLSGGNQLPLVGYLDSRDYSRMSDPEHQTPDSLEARARLVALVSSGRLMLPYSWAHVAESSPDRSKQPEAALARLELMDLLAGAVTFSHPAKIIALENSDTAPSGNILLSALIRATRDHVGRRRRFRFLELRR